MKSRRHAREIVLQALYQFDAQRDYSADGALRFFGAFYPDSVKGDEYLVGEAPYTTFTKDLLLGITEHLVEIDALINASSSNWSIERMQRVDRNILRIATFELLYQNETPLNVVLNEAIEIAKRFGGEESPMFINGVLDEISRRIRLPRDIAGNQ